MLLSFRSPVSSSIMSIMSVCRSVKSPVCLASSWSVCSSIILSSCLSVRSPDRQFSRPSPSVCSTILQSKCLFVCLSIQLPLAEERNFGNRMCTACQSLGATINVLCACRRRKALIVHFHMSYNGNKAHIFDKYGYLSTRIWDLSGARRRRVLYQSNK